MLHVLSKYPRLPHVADTEQAYAAYMVCQYLTLNWCETIVCFHFWHEYTQKCAKIKEGATWINIMLLMKGAVEVEADLRFQLVYLG